MLCASVVSRTGLKATMVVTSWLFLRLFCALTQQSTIVSRPIDPLWMCCACILLRVCCLSWNGRDKCIGEFSLLHDGGVFAPFRLSVADTMRQQTKMTSRDTIDLRYLQCRVFLMTKTGDSSSSRAPWPTKHSISHWLVVVYSKFDVLTDDT